MDEIKFFHSQWHWETIRDSSGNLYGCVERLVVQWNSDILRLESGVLGMISLILAYCRCRPRNGDRGYPRDIIRLAVVHLHPILTNRTNFAIENG